MGRAVRVLTAVRGEPAGAWAGCDGRERLDS